MALAGLYLCAYLIGSVPTAYLLARLAKGIDIRSYGSGNVGASNLVQHAGKQWLIPLVAFDFLGKGVTPFLVGRYVLGLEMGSVELLAAPLLALAGNNWSVFLKFQGGRGIIVVLGVFLAVSSWLLLAGLAVYFGGWILTRNSPVWVLVSLAALPFLATLLGGGPATVGFCGAILALILVKRLTANGLSIHPKMPGGKVLLNRLLFDRDVGRRDDWIHRAPAVPRR